MIAQVRAFDETDQYLFTLEDDGRWTCPDFPEMAETLNSMHSGTYTEWNGVEGAWQANDAAAKLDGEIVYLRRPPRQSR